MKKKIGFIEKNKYRKTLKKITFYINGHITSRDKLFNYKLLKHEHYTSKIFVVFLVQIKCRTTDDNERFKQFKPKFWWFNSDVLRRQFFLSGEKKAESFCEKISDGNKQRIFTCFKNSPWKKSTQVNLLLLYCCSNCGGRNGPSSLHLSHIKSKKLRVVFVQDASGWCGSGCDQRFCR